MFRRLQWKIVVMFVLLVFAIMFIVGGFMVTNIVNFYEKDFKTQMQSVLNSEFAESIDAAFSDNKSGSLKRVEDIISAYSVQLGLGEERKCMILNARDASCIVPTGSIEEFEKTPNIILAMTGKVGDRFQFTSDYMDYAHFVSSSSGEDYIIYIKDTKKDVMTLTGNMMYIILQAILFGVFASIILGYFLSRAITTPITVLTEKAEDFAAGNFDSNLETSSKDEIGTLMETFNYMGKIMSGALDEISGEKHKIEIILEHVTNGIIAFNTEQNIIHINSAAKRLLGIENPDEIKFDDFFAGLGINICMAEFLYIEKIRNEEREIITDDKHIKMYFVPFKVENERVAGVVGVLEDVTEQYRLESSRRKFVAEVSHELKTPLTTIGAYTETLLDGYTEDKETVKSFLTTIQNETVKMTSLVKNLLTLSRFDAQMIERNNEVFSIDSLTRELVKTFEVETKNKNINIEYNLLNEVPDIEADKFQIERAVKNIISNAIKYTESGGSVKVFVGKINKELYIKVEDSGIGIPEADLPNIFDRFYRVDKARSRQQGGTGLGLSISKEIIENHGGNISIESEFGKWTRVTIMLPIKNS